MVAPATCSPSMYMVYHSSELLSVDDHVSETCVGPTSTTATTGLVGAATSPGNVTVTALLEFDRFPERSRAYTRRVYVLAGCRHSMVWLVWLWLTVMFGPAPLIR